MRLVKLIFVLAAIASNLAPAEGFYTPEGYRRVSSLPPGTVLRLKESLSLSPYSSQLDLGEGSATLVLPASNYYYTYVPAGTELALGNPYANGCDVSPWNSNSSIGLVGRYGNGWNLTLNLHRWWSSYLDDWRRAKVEDLEAYFYVFVPICNPPPTPVPHFVQRTSAPQYETVNGITYVRYYIGTWDNWANVWVPNDGYFTHWKYFSGEACPVEHPCPPHPERCEPARPCDQDRCEPSRPCYPTHIEPPPYPSDPPTAGYDYYPPPSSGGRNADEVPPSDHAGLMDNVYERSH